MLSLTRFWGLINQAAEYSPEFAQFFVPVVVCTACLVVLCTACLVFEPKKRLDKDDRQMPEKKPEHDRPSDRPPDLIQPARLTERPPDLVPAALNFIIRLAIFLAVTKSTYGREYGDAVGMVLAVGMWRSARALWASVRARSGAAGRYHRAVDGV